MIAFLLWLLLLVVAWPVAVLALILLPLVWLLHLLFRLAGISVRGVFDLSKRCSVFRPDSCEATKGPVDKTRPRVERRPIP
ncbi:MAG: hypothetical protein ACE5MI_02900 [Acidimicrobiia bacterium]